MTTLTKTTIDSCQNISALNTLISQPGVRLAPHLATLVAKVTTLVEKDYQDLNYRYIGVKDLNQVCEILGKEKIDLLPLSEQESFKRISIASKDKIREMNSPYKEMPFAQLVATTRLSIYVVPDNETRARLDAISYQLVLNMGDNRVGEKMIEAVRLSASNEAIFSFVLSFIACKLSVREFYFLLERALPERVGYFEPILSQIFRDYYLMPSFLQNNCVFINLERIYGPSFKDENYKLPPFFLECLQFTLRMTKESKVVVKKAIFNNSTAKVPLSLIAPFNGIIKKTFSDNVEILILPST